MRSKTANRRTHTLATAAIAALPTLAIAQTDVEPNPKFHVSHDGVITANGKVFDSWRAYISSIEFLRNGARCGKPASNPDHAVRGGTGGDCTFTLTNPSPVYAPSVVKYRIPVVVHVIQNTNGDGFISEAMVRSQIDILNEDFLALPGTNGANGTDVQIEFYLATQTPSGQATNGITYSTNNSWFNDNGNYWESLAWDTSRYMNIYTNSAGGNLGYVPNLPQGNIAGTPGDRVVVLWNSFGRNSPIGPPFNLGRTTTHEVGHYLGLEHTFTGGCGDTDCYTSGDLICDTNPQLNPTDGCSGSSCGSADPTNNYMDYSNDSCMTRFTPEQARRMRCSLEHYRPLLAEVTTSQPTVQISVATPPAVIAPGAQTTIDVTISPVDQDIVSGTPQLNYRFDSGAFASVQLVNIGGEQYRATLPAPDCGDMPEFYVTAEGSVSGVIAEPAGAPTTPPFAATVGITSNQTALSTSFESGVPAGWLATGLWHTTGSCGVGSTCDGNTWAYFGRDSDCTYNVGTTTGSLRTTPIPIPASSGSGGSTLSFCSNMQSEGDSEFDIAEVLVNGARVLLEGETPTWTNRTVDLSAWAGQTVVIEWRFRTLDGELNAFRGWQIDKVEVSVTGTTCEQPPACPCERNDDGIVNADDLLDFLSDFFQGDADYNDDGITNADDLLAFLSCFFVPPSGC